MTAVDDPRISATATPAPSPSGQVDRNADRFLRGEILAELNRTVDHEDVVFAVRTRPGWSVRYSTDIDADLVDEWTKNSRTDEGISVFRLALHTLAGQCRGFVRSGEQIPLTFASPEMLEVYGALLAPECVRAFYGDDTLVTSTYTSLLNETGAGERLDPTTGSSG